MSVAAIARMASPKPLDEKAARRLDSDDWVDELRELPAKITDENRVQAVAGIKALLRLTRSSRVRNAAALALTDIVEAEAATAIATVLRRPELATSAELSSLPSMTSGPRCRSILSSRWSRTVRLRHGRRRPRFWRRGELSRCSGLIWRMPGHG